MPKKKKVDSVVKKAKEEEHKPFGGYESKQIAPLGVGFQTEDMNLLVAKVNEIIEHINES